METLQMGLIPIHVHHDDPLPSEEKESNEEEWEYGEEAWLPYEGMVMHESLGFSTDFSHIPSIISNKLASKSIQDIEEIEAKIVSLKKDYFTVEGVLKQIELFMQSKKDDIKYLVRRHASSSSSSPMQKEDQANYKEVNDSVDDNDAAAAVGAGGAGDDDDDDKEEKNKGSYWRVGSTTNELVCRTLPKYPRSTKPHLVVHQGREIQMKEAYMCGPLLADEGFLW
jgi:uncharacterized protein YhaN